MVPRDAQTLQGASVRQVHPSDVQAIRRLHEQAFPLRYKESYYEKLVNGQVWGVVTEEDSTGELIGVLTGEFVPERLARDAPLLSRFTLFGEPRLAYIMTLAVSSTYHRQGIATQMLAQFESSARRERCRYMYLHVLDTNEGAMRFYEQQGFDRVALIRNFYFIDAAPRNALTYHKQLHEELGGWIARLFGTLLSFLRRSSPARTANEQV